MILYMCNPIGYTDPRGVNPEHVAKLRNILATLNAAATVAHMDLLSFRYIPSKARKKAFGP
jgi:hypothetical protein